MDFVAGIEIFHLSNRSVANSSLATVALKKQNVLAIIFGRKIGFNLEVLKQQIRYCVEVRICDL